MMNATNRFAGCHQIIGAIDAGSNALRAAVAHVDEAGQPMVIARRRIPVRLGHRVFTEELLSVETIAEAVNAFDALAGFLAGHGVEMLRAVGTSAVRAARNRARLQSAIYGRTGIELAAIHGNDEAALVRQAVCRAFGHLPPPRVIADLGGGSLELSLLSSGVFERSRVLPLGTVRLLETRGLRGPISPADAARLRTDIIFQLEDTLGLPPMLDGGAVAVTGGNARTLARLAPGVRHGSMPSIHIDALLPVITQSCALTVPQRMETYEVRRDRAEVLGVAAIALATLAEWLGADELVVPGVGLIEGILLDVAQRSTSRRLQPHRHTDEQRLTPGIANVFFE
jgi:exopolyphosphatase/guanosine-5'-triphosphate,3'-diphosphate pyrophosphatase